MSIISTTIEYKGVPIKIENGKLYMLFFGTTYYNKSMHWSWCEIKIDDLKPECKKYLKDLKLI